MQPRAFTIVYVFMRSRWSVLLLCLAASSANAQLQVELKFPRLQYIAYEPVAANLVITNLAGRDVDLHDGDGQSWFGFEVTGNEGRSIAPIPNAVRQPRRTAARQPVTGPITLTRHYGTL